MPKLVSILSGGDWYDASVEYVVVNDDVDLNEIKALYENWRKTEYEPALRKNKNLKWVSFATYLINNGYARRANEGDIKEFWE